MDHAASPTHIILIGPMGAGKTTIGRGVSRVLGLPLVDSDTEIELREGTTGAAIAEDQGVERLHEIELEVFLSMAAGSSPTVICPAASVVDTVEGRDALASNTTIWVDADDQTLLERREESTHRRSMDLDEFAARRSTRGPHLAAVSEVRLDTASMTIDECIADVCARAGVQR